MIFFSYLFSRQSKPPPPPPTGFPKVSQTAPSGPGGPPSAPVNIFSRRAGNRHGRLHIFYCIIYEDRTPGFSGVALEQLASQ